MPAILLFNADDWGLSESIHAAITSLHQAKAIDAAGIMMGQAHTGRALDYASANPDLKTGIHLFANDPDCRPMTRRSWPKPWPHRSLIFGGIHLRRYREAALEEADAQLLAWKQTGLPLHFVNSHMNYHAVKEHLGEFISLVKKHFPGFAGWIRLGDPRYFAGTVFDVVEPLLHIFERKAVAMKWDGRSNDTIWGTGRLFKNRPGDILRAAAELGDGFHEFYFHPGRGKSLAHSGTDHAALMELVTHLPAERRNVSLLPHP